MSYTSNYNLNIRLSNIESQLKNGIPTTSNLDVVLFNGNSAGGNNIDMNNNNITNINSLSGVSGNNLSIDSTNQVNIITPTTQITPDGYSSVIINSQAVTTSSTNPAFGDDIYTIISDPVNAISINYNNGAYTTRSILTISDLYVGFNTNNSSNTGTIHCDTIQASNLEGISLTPLNLTSTDTININSSDNTNIDSSASIVLSAFDDINLNTLNGNVYINGSIPLTSNPTLEQVLTAGNSGTNGQTLSLNTAGAITTYGGYIIDCDSDFIVRSSGGDVMDLGCAGNFFSIYRNNTIIPEGYIYKFGGTQVGIDSSNIIITDGITTNTINKNGYTTRNSVQNTNHYLNFSDNSSTGIGAIQKTAGISCNPSLNSITATTFNGALNGNATNSNNSVITTALTDASYTLLVATANSGTLPILGSGSDLNYNPVSQTLSVKNMSVSGNETQTGIITTNVLRTDIMIQQVSYLTLQTNNIANFTALLALGTFIMSSFSNSTVANTIITVGLPALPNDGSYDGYTFQLRKLNGGVNQTTQNWTITAPTAIIIPNGNTLNSGSGGANSSSSPASFTQRYTIVTTGGVGYYIGCNN